MTRAGRPKSVFIDPVNISCQCERWKHDIVVRFKIPESTVYRKGLDAIIQERIGDLTEENIQRLIQEEREKMEKIQGDIMTLERMLLDARVKDQTRGLRAQKKIETRHDDRGKAYQVVIAE